MDSWKSTQSSPELKLEHSPAESFLSAPGELYPSLFGTPSREATMDPSEMMTPASAHYDETADMDLLSGLDGTADDANPSASATEKKQNKKRKSWGQVLPEPKTNLPPRKRAKTEDEKEQRRVERVLRNRRAAQSSRERKRLEVEALEQRNKELEMQVMHFQKMTVLLTEELNKTRRNSGVVSSRQNPVTLSQELFSSQDSHGASPTALSEQSKQSLMDELLMSAESQSTVNPASISPALSPVADSPSYLPNVGDHTFDEAPEETETAKMKAAATEAQEDAVRTSPDLTQHPAEMLWRDLQCRSAEVPRLPSTLSMRSTPSRLSTALYWQLTVFLTSAATILSVCRRPLTQIAMSLRVGFSLPPTAPILNTIIWLVTQPSPSRRRRRVASTSSTSTTTSTTTPTTTAAATATSTPSSSTTLPPPPSAASAASSRTPLTTLRLRTLRKILACSPDLARPLLDATLAALRLVQSEERRGADRVSQDGNESIAAEPEIVVFGSNGSAGQGFQWLRLNGASLPSKEVLLTLLWAIRVEERMMTIRQRDKNPDFGRLEQQASVAMISAPPPARNQKIVLKVQHSNKRTREEPLEEAATWAKRQRQS